MHHSSFQPNNSNFQRKAGGRLVLSTPDVERFVILGNYGVKVHQGEVTIAGATLTPIDDVQWVHAPHCHALPVLRTANDTVIELLPCPTAQGLRELARLNPLFGRLWNETSDTFQIIYTSADAPKRTSLRELASHPAWNKKISELLTSTRRKPSPILFICGPKSSGKSTFGRLLTNRLMTDRAGHKSRSWKPVMVLDLDPGQPEFSPPGVVSLTKLRRPNLAPPFCHPGLSFGEKGLDGGNEGMTTVRMHAIASVTPALDPAHFIACARDLFAYYRRSASQENIPLVVNTPGWIQGTGLDLLAELIAVLRPTEVLYMSEDGPEETVSALREACASSSTIPFTMLPSQPNSSGEGGGGGAASWTPATLRSMAMQSYFHLSPFSRDQQGGPGCEWNPTPLTHLCPWRVRLAGRPDERGVLGIVCYDHQYAPELVSDAINGMVMGLVRIEKKEALRGLAVPGDTSLSFTSSTSQGGCDDELDSDSNSSSAPSFTSSSPSHLNSTPLLPLIPNPTGSPLSPQYTSLVGLVLIRGVSLTASNPELHLLTPVPPSVLHSFRGDELVLVAGKFDAPTWAYVEGLYWKSNSKAAKRVDEEREDEDREESGGVEEEEEQDEVPWVEMLHGSAGRDVGSRVWRVRRDLGRS
uniref:CLP1_P domain-containing protein n=1 Tax=Chaetomium thermophilum (strain DSM 1495 / CBS 144.50 / IMI 039719) TaxID=759272 RepID=UPI0011EA6034|nr:Chain B, CLP1_P domain-containing protein [Thermochaetoides thermophila DSM 1495]6OF2_E Chain E, CLP1_P domain-containing protein [Thermochaetoides thermophila DSM 1495]6OF3_B Chain B, CLP1_P domain-containing protein [Thermochaetoides thermophila DSM 1495]6OF3_E Chain E, CLP1_P domain-containing protein [Thermochaetoides thermophila DSM 1495]6OF4_B Chain B, CLP1_P domain-containing protein [Thermochaetoides thermophila DSM 1495]6OF4_E Chain E, CLP1_P domain-containing protein [Thermochaeto